MELAGETLYLREHPARPDNAEYVALSYCWGTKGNFKTLEENRQSHMRGIAISLLPKTLRDAVRVCQAFNARYLWIDALCIIQDDRDDWMEQIPMMSDIYAGALFVFAAECAASVYDGCLELGVSKNAPFQRLDIEHSFGDEAPRKLSIAIQEEEIPYHVDPGHHSSRPDWNKHEISPLGTRAWAFQERFLAVRTLFSTASEFSWQCSLSTWCECRKEPRSAHPSILEDYWGVGQFTAILNSEYSMVDGPMRKLSIWCEIVRQYSQRLLTNWTDRVAAMQGIVVALQQAFPDSFQQHDFMAGMWRPFVTRLLCWDRMTLDDISSEQSMKGLVPSWSWMGATGPIEYSNDCFKSDSQEMIEVFGVRFTPAKDGAFGEGQGEIEAEGLLIPVDGEKNPYMGDFAMPEYRVPDIFMDAEELKFDVTLNIHLDDPTDSSAWETVTHLLPLIRSDGGNLQYIYLAPVDGHSDTFRRIGYLQDSITIKLPDESDMAPYRKTFTLV